jgi:translation initiation factor 3 subunit L
VNFILIQHAVFSRDTAQQITLSKLRSYLRLYSSIEVGKMAGLNDIDEKEFTSRLLSYKSRVLSRQATSVGMPASNDERKSDLHYFIENGHLIVDSLTGKSDKTRAAERFFISGVRKHSDIRSDLQKVFEKHGL